MATLQELEARREELIKRRESLVTRARTGDKDVQYDRVIQRPLFVFRWPDPKSQRQADLWCVGGQSYSVEQLPNWESVIT